MALKKNSKSRFHARLILLVLAVIFMLGTVISFVLIESGWRPEHTKNYGDLVEPAHRITDREYTRLDGQPVQFYSLHGKWSLVYFGNAECLKVCTESLYKMRQIAAAQGREAGRVQRIFMVVDTQALDTLRHRLEDYPGMEVFIGPTENIQRLTEEFSLTVNNSLDLKERIYIVDPLGNLMMSYPHDADPRRMNNDLKLLLRASQIG